MFVFLSYAVATISGYR